MGRPMTLLVIFGALLLLLGIAGLVAPVFTTQQTTELARIGELKVQTQEERPHAIPPLLSGSAVIIGIILIGGGFYRKW